MGLNPYILILAYINISIHTSLKKIKVEQFSYYPIYFLSIICIFFPLRKGRKFPTKSFLI